MNHRYNPDMHYRRSIRLRGYDYTHAGAYYVTIVAQDRVCLFGEVVGEKVRLGEASVMVQAVWEALPHRFPSIETDAFVVMPNHIHGIIVIDGPVGASLVSLRSQLSRAACWREVYPHRKSRRYWRRGICRFER